MSWGSDFRFITTAPRVVGEREGSYIGKGLLPHSKLCNRRICKWIQLASAQTSNTETVIVELGASDLFFVVVVVLIPLLLLAIVVGLFERVCVMSAENCTC